MGAGAISRLHWPACARPGRQTTPGRAAAYHRQPLLMMLARLLAGFFSQVIKKSRHQRRARLKAQQGAFGAVSRRSASRLPLARLKAQLKPLTTSPATWLSASSHNKFSHQPYWLLLGMVFVYRIDAMPLPKSRGKIPAKVLHCTYASSIAMRRLTYTPPRRYSWVAAT